jgi:hypothetical protein
MNTGRRIGRWAALIVLLALMPCLLFAIERAESAGLFGRFVQENLETGRRAVGIFWTDTPLLKAK